MSASDRIYLGTNDGLRVLRCSQDGEGWSLETVALDNAPLTAIVRAPDGSGDLLCGMGVWGIWRCNDEGKETRERNIGVANREIHALAVSSDGSSLYAGTAPPELYRSTDGGDSWETIDSFGRIPGADRWFYPVPPNYANIRQIAADPSNAAILYVGIEVGGLFRTRDGGETWEDLTGDMDPDCHAIGLHAGRPGRILVSTPRGPYVSRDGGGSWVRCWKDRTPTYSASVAVCPDAPDVIVAGISKGFRGAGATIWVSEDGAETWHTAEGDLAALFDSQIRGALVYSGSEPNTAFAGSLAGDLFQSRDGGRSWRTAFRGLPPIRSIFAP